MKKPRIAYVDSRLEREGHVFGIGGNLVSRMKGKEYRSAMKTVRHLRKKYRVNCFTEFSEQAAGEIAESHGRNPYYALVVELEQHPEDATLPYQRVTSHFEMYQRSMRLLEMTIARVKEANVVLYMAEGWDIMDGALRECGIENLVQKRHSPFDIKRWWEMEMERLEKAIEDRLEFRLDTSGMEAFCNACRVLEG